MIAEARAAKSPSENSPSEKSPSEPLAGASPADRFPFDRGRIVPGRILLTAREEIRVSEPLLALVEGIEIGRSALPGACAAGEEVAIPIRRFPFVALPCEIRFSGEDGLDVAPALPVASAAEAVRLAGPGEVTCDGLRIENGIVTGTATNAINGLAMPVLLAKINEVVRQVQVGPLRLRDEGGSTCRISLSLDAGDLTETGASLSIHTLPSFEPIAHLQFARTERDALAEAVTRLEAKVAQLAARARIDAAGHRRFLEEAVARQQTRLDDVIEYFAALVYDRGAQAPGDPLAAAEIDQTIRTFYETIRQPRSGRTAPQARDIVPLAPAHAAYGDDWYRLEAYGDTPPFRWMPQAATLFNPAADRRVTGLLVSVFSYVGDTRPDLFLALDDGEALLGEPLGLINGRSYTLRFALPAPRHFGVARLTASCALRPSDIDKASSDTRLLSFGITGVRLLLEAEDADGSENPSG
ncbi:hypothetical protein [Methylobacterium isbiliense]|uniref:Uncharacterized protein n=1 Tax=Methylobacterium isbiliense TaxID=315478 RepID=A0ABQ4SLH7_9HYPH|nr:hypothetical protein [Methylobacterium isbiliense]MDN3625790.1 hypothetical protein [Methylobacterium isbiliense]GJE02541.1 hypothetical protein GMJLKIPL_4490 [Methylobacterium isbiliense]